MNKRLGFALVTILIVAGLTLACGAAEEPASVAPASSSESAAPHCRARSRS